MMNRKKPLIGIACGYVEDDRPGIIAELGFRGQSWNMVYGEYSECIELAGGVPVLVPVYKQKDLRDSVLECLDGILLTGGTDIDPDVIGGDEHPTIHDTCPGRDIQELRLVRGALEMGIGILAICRGCQILNAAGGGTLYPDVPSAGFQNHLFADGREREYIHGVVLEEGSLSYEIFRTKELRVNSLHHQGIRTTGKDFFAAGRASDGLIECIQHKTASFVLGVQWHPELLDADERQWALFHAFVAGCR